MIVTMMTKYIAPFFQLHHLLYLLHPPDLYLSRVFLSPSSVLPSSIILVINIFYLRIIIIEKLIGLDRLACCCYSACYVFVNSLIARAKPAFNSINTIYKSFLGYCDLLKINNV